MFSFILSHSLSHPLSQKDVSEIRQVSLGVGGPVRKQWTLLDTKELEILSGPVTWNAYF